MLTRLHGRTSLPTVALMHPTQIAGPFRREGWVFEEKVDGYRITAIHSREVIARLGLVLAD